MYVRTKNIKGHTYYYLVEGHRVNGKVMQKVIQYLGKEGWGGITPTRFVGVGAGADTSDTATVSQLRKKITKACKSLNCEVSYNLRKKNASGEFNFTFSSVDGSTKRVYRNRRIRIRKDASFSTLCHEFGHLIDYELREQGVEFSKEIEKLNGASSEIEAIAKNKYPSSFAYVSGWTDEGRKRATPRERAALRSHQKFITDYAQSFDETFANVFALCLTEPDKVERLAPKITKLIMELVQQDQNVRDVLTRLEVWELGTTNDTGEN